MGARGRNLSVKSLRFGQFRVPPHAPILLNLSLQHFAEGTPLGVVELLRIVM